MVDVKNVSLTIGKNEILKSVTVSFEKGKIHGLIGRNGSGKTIIIASHSSEDIEVLCDTVCEMDKGVLTKLTG